MSLTTLARAPRLAALVVAASTLLAGPATSAAAATSSPAVADAVPAASTFRAETAAGWLARQLVDGDHFEVTFDGTAYPDAGLTLDAVLAFAAAKVANAQGAAALTWLSDPGQLAGYIGDGSAESYAGAHAKLVLALSVRGVDPHAFGGRDVAAELLALRGANGRFSDKSAFGDFSNAFSQSLAVVALDRLGQGTWTASGFLAAQACADGGMPITFGAATCTPEVDATALAVQAFLASGRTTAAARAVAWLRAHQAADGSLGNANSTGLAAAAFAAAGRPVFAARARTFLASLQQGCDAPEAQRRAIALELGGFDPSTAPRATAQAVLGLASTNLATLTAAGSRNTLPTRCGVTP